MKRIAVILSLAVLACTARVYASDSIGLGVRAGAAANAGNSQFYEAFADLYLNRLISVGAEVAYVVADYKNLNTVRRDESMPITALFKVHAPIPFLSPYAGAGQALIFHDRRATKGSPVFLGGLDFGFGLPLLFVNVEYRRQVDDKLDFIAGGVGVKF